MVASARDAAHAALTARATLTALTLLAALACAACATDPSRWGRGESHELRTYSGIEFRRGPQKVDPATGELSIAWVGARAPQGSPSLLQCHLVIFDDRNGNGVPDPGEVLEERTSRETSRKVLFDDVRAHPADAKGHLMAELEAKTEVKGRLVRWRLEPD